jgi:hemolysin III
VGTLLKAVHGFRWPRLSLALYLAMGWLAVVAAGPLVTHVATWGLVWLVAGGLAYTAGVAFYRAPRLRYAHFVWHLFVLAGTACHVIAVHEFAI